MTEAAAKYWCDIYEPLSKGMGGLLGAITNRAEAQTVRLALIYALLDQATQIDVAHLDAGLAVWRFCDASARHIFGDTLGNPNADTILRALRVAGTAGMTRTDLFTLFGRNLPASKIDAALMILQTNGKARRQMSPASPRGGRPTERWFAM